MSTITVKQWEDGYKLPDDCWIPEYQYFPTFGTILIGFRGKNTGIVIERQFGEVLENDKNMSL